MQFPLRSYLVHVCTQHIYTLMPLKEETVLMPLPLSCLLIHFWKMQKWIPHFSYLTTTVFSLYSLFFFHWEFYSQWITAYKINLYRAILAPADMFNFGSAECVLWCSLFFFFDDIGAALTLNAITLVGGRSFVFSAWITCIFRVLKTWCLASDLNPFLNEMEKRNCNCKPQEYSVSTCVSFNAIWLFTDCLKYFLDCETSCQFSSC